MGVASWCGLAFDGRRVALAFEERASKAASIGILDIESGELRHMPFGRAGARRTPFFAAGGEELWLFDGERRVERFALD